MTHRQFFDFLSFFSIRTQFLKKLGLVPAAVLQSLVNKSVEQKSSTLSFKNLEKLSDECGLPNTDIWHKATLKLQDLGYIEVLSPSQIRKGIHYTLDWDKISAIGND